MSLYPYICIYILTYMHIEEHVGMRSLRERHAIHLVLDMQCAHALGQRAHMHAHMLVPIHVHKHEHKHKHKHIYMYIHVHIHVHTHTWSRRDEVWRVFGLLRRVEGMLESGLNSFREYVGSSGTKVISALFQSFEEEVRAIGKTCMYTRMCV